MLQLAGLDLGQVEDVGDDAGQRLRALGDLVQVLQALRLGRLGRARQPGQADHAVQRRAQFVAGVGQEGALGAAGGLGIVARAGQRQFELAPLGDVLDDPHRAAFGRALGVDGAAAHARQEGAAVLAAAAPLQLHRLAARQRRARPAGARRRSRRRSATPSARAGRSVPPGSQP